MPRVLEEVTNPSMDRDQIERRIVDWADRIDRLYAQIEQWLPTGWTVDRSHTTGMHEELMRQVGLGPRQLPVLRLFHNGQLAGRIEPRGLWIIGANGRLDFFRGGEHFLIVDAAENFEPPIWRMASLSDRGRMTTFDQQALIKAL
jgi:hypothetical protein